MRASFSPEWLRLPALIVSGMEDDQCAPDPGAVVAAPADIMPARRIVCGLELLGIVARASESADGLVREIHGPLFSHECGQAVPPFRAGDLAQALDRPSAQGDRATVRSIAARHQ